MSSADTSSADTSSVDATSAADPERQRLAERDRRDALTPLRDHFVLPDGLIYLDGNSLGPLTHAGRRRMTRVLDDEWGEGLVRSWGTAGWIDLSRSVASKIAPLLGAAPDQVQVTDSTSVNLFKLLSVAVALRPDRPVLLTEAEQFPSDLYVAQELARRHPDLELRVVPRSDLDAALDEQVAVLFLTHVDFRSGALHDLAQRTRQAHDVGALVLWDLAHSAGAVPLSLDACGVDLAVGCGYKFLNGGPGAPAFLYVAQRWQEQTRNPIAGWLGHADPFAFEGTYRPAAGIDRLLSGTPPILSLAALDAALTVFAETSVEALYRKSLELGDLFLDQVATRCAGLGLEPVCPGPGEPRGSQVALRHPEGYAIVQALIARGVLGDFRAPDVLRFGIAPLYLRRVDVFDAVEHLATILEDALWRDPAYQQRGKVT